MDMLGHLLVSYYSLWFRSRVTLLHARTTYNTTCYADIHVPVLQSKFLQVFIL